MNTNIKKYKVVIQGSEYSLVTDETEHHIRKAASMVNEIVGDIESHFDSNDSKKALVIASLQLASLLLRAQEERDETKLKEELLVELIDRTLTFV